MSTRKIAAHVRTIEHESGKTPVAGEENILVTSALPYVNNVPHLGNIVGSVLSADVFSRYNRSRNRNTLFVSGTDEYGTATETKALEEETTPQALCDKYHHIHKEVYDWFDIDFDYFGRTTTSKQTEIAQHIFKKLHGNGYLEERIDKQPFCTKHGSFLADRFVEGTCPNCGYEDARGDQCDKCGRLLNALDLQNPRCKLDGVSPETRETTHIHLCLDKIQPELESWFVNSSTEGAWSKNGVSITNSWLKEGLKSRAITRDLKWGTPVPLPGYGDKVLYVWFDACIGYLSITACHTHDWELWWRSKEVRLYQFMGKDNVPFHSVIFPSSQIGTKEDWTMLHHLSTTEYLNYEHGKFSKSRGIGVFGDNAKQTGIQASVWRYYLMSCRPETNDSQFQWSTFVHKNNSELVANLGNLVNRVIRFTNKNFSSEVPDFRSKLNDPEFDAFESEINTLLTRYIDDMEHVRLRAGLASAMAISTRANQFLTENKFGAALLTDDPDSLRGVVGAVLNVIYLLSAVIFPYMPTVSYEITNQLNAPIRAVEPGWRIGDLLPGHKILPGKHLFKKIDEGMAEQWKAQFGGSALADASKAVSPQVATGAQKKSKSQKANKFHPSGQPSPAVLDLRVGHIVRAVKHPNAESLYVSTVECGDEPGEKDTFLDIGTGKTVRSVCSALNGKIPLSEMQDRRVVLLTNLKPARMRGIDSTAMILTAMDEGSGTTSSIEIVQPPDTAKVGEGLSFEGLSKESSHIPLRVKSEVWTTLQANLTTNGSGEIEIHEESIDVANEGQKNGGRKLISSDGRVCRVTSLFNASVC